MRFEDLKHDFPKMPEEMRAMIEKEVEKQIKQTERKQTEVRKSRFRGRRALGRTLAASLAAVMLCGLTVFAGAGIYRLSQEKKGEHGVSVNITGSESVAPDASGEDFVIPNVRMEAGYLPEGMVKTEQGKYSFEDALNLGGVTMTFYRMDTGDDKFEVEHGDVLFGEEFSAGGYQGVYLEYPHLNKDEISFNKQIYVAFTDVHYVMKMYAASDVSKEEALKIAQNIKLIPTDDTKDEDFVTAWNWSSREGDFGGKSAAGEGCETITSVAREKMDNTHVVGESFAVNGEGLTAKVSEVKIADDLSFLDAALVDEDLKNETDGSGKLRPATISYMKKGDMNTLSREVKSREAAQKLVFAAVEYTNTGREEMTDVLFSGSLARIREEGGQMRMIAEEEPAVGDEWEMAVNQGLSDRRGMIYYDVHGGERGNNYIGSIKAGETVTVHMAWIVTEEELNMLYLTLDTSGGDYEFTDSSLDIGYVDIRQ